MAIDKKKKAKADKLAGDIVRARGYCQAAGYSKVRCGGVLQWAHIITRGNHRLRWDLQGALCLCAGHHVYFTHHPDEWFQDFLPQFFPQEDKYTQAHKREYFDGDIDKVIEELQHASNN